MEGLLQYVARLGGTVQLMGLDFLINIPNTLSTEQVFHFAMFVESLNADSGHDLYIPPDQVAFFPDNSIVLKGSVHEPRW
ncbi:hypothetical protein IPM19_01845 [bacterium]|nr:MAG: hypothetical protein IPM19_01845 [bacterium]